MALAGDRCAAVWHPDGTFQFIADAFHVGAGCYPASEVFTEKDSVVTYLAGMAVLASTVTGIQLSYRFQSPVFGCSFLFSVLAAERVVRAADFRKAVVQGALLLVMSLACYQTSLDNFCLLLLTYLLLLLFRNVDREKVHAHIGRSLCSAAAGMVLYFLLTKLIVWACGWQMASYNGGADVSVLSILKNLPNAIAETYQLFGAYFFRITIGITFCSRWAFSFWYFWR